MVPAASESEATRTCRRSTASGLRSMSGSTAETLAGASPPAGYAGASNHRAALVHPTGADSTRTKFLRNSNDTVTASSRPACRCPPVGPDPMVRGTVSGEPSPSASCSNPVRITSPANTPLPGPVSTRRYGDSSWPRVLTLTACVSIPPIVSIPSAFAFQLGATIVMRTLSVHVYDGLSKYIGAYGRSGSGRGSSAKAGAAAPAATMASASASEAAGATLADIAPRRGGGRLKEVRAEAGRRMPAPPRIRQAAAGQRG